MPVRSDGSTRRGSSARSTRRFKWTWSRILGVVLLVLAVAFAVALLISLALR